MLDAEIKKEEKGPMNRISTGIQQRRADVAGGGIPNSKLRTTLIDPSTSTTRTVEVEPEPDSTIYQILQYRHSQQAKGIAKDSLRAQRKGKVT
jgi:hypothetical protein